MHHAKEVKGFECTLLATFSTTLAKFDSYGFPSPSFDKKTRTPSTYDCNVSTDYSISFGSATSDYSSFQVILIIALKLFHIHTLGKCS